MSQDQQPPRNSGEPVRPVIQPDNIWSSRRLRRRQASAKREKSKSGKEFGAASRHRLGFLSVVTGGLCIAVLAAVITALVWHFLRKPAKISAPAPGPEVVEEQWKGPVPSEARDGFLAAKTHSERMRWVRSPELVEPLVTAFYTTGPGSREKFTDMASMPLPEYGPDQPAQEIARYGVLMEDGGKRLISIIGTPDGAKVDFHTYSRHTSVPWPEILEGRAASAEVRVFASAGTFQLAPFHDAAVWMPVTAACPDLPADLVLYARRGTPECAALEAAILAAPLRVTITIAPVQDSWRQRLFQVTAFHAREWLGRQQ